MTDDALVSSKKKVLCRYMMHSHDYLRDLFTRLLAAMAIEDRTDASRLWNELDHTLTAHMRAEERFVLPAFATVDRHESLALVREHSAFRELLFELGVAIDLHSLRYERSHEFIRLLLSHAEREERLLYRWADETLPPTVIETLEHHVWIPTDVKTAQVLQQP